MKNNLLLSSSLLLAVTVFSQNEKEGQLLKYAAADSQITVNTEVKNQFEKAFKNRKNNQGNFLLTGEKNEKENISRWLMSRNRQNIYLVNLSAIMSKYIGETEKNLDQVFSNAENKNWILFFDEADALFGKRTTVKDSHDKYANQEISYLHQKITMHKGIVLVNCKTDDCIESFQKTNFIKLINKDN